MKIRLWSDIHLEFGPMNWTRLDTDKDTVLVIAGDFDVGVQSFDLLRDLSHAFLAVVFVPGNHDYYKNDIIDVNKSFRKFADSIQNFHFLNPGYIVIDDVRFIGGTLWTDFNNENPDIMLRAYEYMNDYRQIKIGGEHLLPDDIYQINQDHRDFFKSVLDDDLFIGKTVIVTHHAPMVEFIAETNPGPMDFCYGNTGIEPWFFEKNFDAWMHGHTHTEMTNYVNNRPIYCRPRGYIGHQSCATKYDMLNYDARIIEL